MCGWNCSTSCTSAGMCSHASRIIVPCETVKGRQSQSAGWLLSTGGRVGVASPSTDASREEVTMLDSHLSKRNGFGGSDWVPPPPPPPPGHRLQANDRVQDHPAVVTIEYYACNCAQSH